MEQTHYQQLRWILSLAALTLLCLGLYYVFSPFIVAVCWAAILVLTTWPIATRLSHIIPRRPYLVATIMTALLLFLLVGAVAPIISTLTSETEQLGKSIRAWVLNVEAEPPPALLNVPVIGEFVYQRIQELHRRHEEIPKFLSDYQQHLVQFATLAAKGVFGAIANIAICLVTAFFFFVHGSQLAAQIERAFSRIGGARFSQLLEATRATVRATVYGVLATALAQGILAGIGYLVVGAPVPFLLGLITMVFSLVPFGTPAVYLPVALFIVLSGSPWYYGVLLASWGILVVSMVDNVLRPLFISQATQMPLLLVFFGVIGGMASFGLLGIFAGPALIAIAQVLWKEWTAT